MENKTVKGDLLPELSPFRVIHSASDGMTQPLDIIYFSPVKLVAKFQYEPRP